MNFKHKTIVKVTFDHFRFHTDFTPWAHDGLVSLSESRAWWALNTKTKINLTKKFKLIDRNLNFAFKLTNSSCSIQYETIFTSELPIINWDNISDFWNSEVMEVSSDKKFLSFFILFWCTHLDGRTLIYNTRKIQIELDSTVCEINYNMLTIGLQIVWDA